MSAPPDEERATDELLASALRSAAVECPGQDRNWIQSILHGQLDQATQQLDEYLRTPPAFLWMAIAIAIRRDKKDLLPYLTSLPGLCLPDPIMQCFLYYTAITKDDPHLVETLSEILDVADGDRTDSANSSPEGVPSDDDLHYDPEFTSNPIYELYQAQGCLQRADLLRVACRLHAHRIIQFAYNGPYRWCSLLGPVLNERWKEGQNFPPLITRIFLAVRCTSGTPEDEYCEIIWRFISARDTANLRALILPEERAALQEQEPIYRYPINITQKMEHKFLRRVCDGSFWVTQNFASQDIAAAMKYILEIIRDWIFQDQRIHTLVASAAQNCSAEFLRSLYCVVAEKQKIDQEELERVQNNLEEHLYFLFQQFPSPTSDLREIVENFTRMPNDSKTMQDVVRVLLRIDPSLGVKAINRGRIIEPHWLVTALRQSEMSYPIDAAVAYWSIDIVRTMLQAGADKDLQGEGMQPFRRIPLQSAVLRGNPEMIRLLFQAGVSESSLRMNPLKLLAEVSTSSDEDIEECMHMFLKPEYEILEEPTTLLHVACQEVNVPMIRVLLGRTSGKEALSKRDAIGNTPLLSCFMQSTNRRLVDAVHLVIAQTPENIIHVPNQSGNTVFHRMMEQPNTDLILELLQRMKPEEAQLRNQAKATPLACLLIRWNACEQENVEGGEHTEGVFSVIKQLVELGGREQLLLTEGNGLIKPFHRICCLEPLGLALKVLDYFLDQVPEYTHWDQFSDDGLQHNLTIHPDSCHLWLLFLRRQVITKEKFSQLQIPDSIRTRVNEECERLCRKSAHSDLLCKRSAEQAGLDPHKEH